MNEAIQNRVQHLVGIHSEPTKPYGERFSELSARATEAWQKVVALGRRSGRLIAIS
jgi:broad specificity phosphatase PhoE